MLEPGDATVYRFLLAPCWEDLIHPACGGGIGDGSDYIFVCGLNHRSYPLRKGSDIGYIVGKMMVSHSTATVLAAFLDELWDTIDSMSGDNPEALSTLAGDV